MAKDGLLIYFVTDGPVPMYTSEGREVWQVQAQVSDDNGKTCEPMVFTFDTEEHAIKFKRDINYKMEPTKLGEKE